MTTFSLVLVLYQNNLFQLVMYVIVIIPSNSRVRFLPLSSHFLTTNLLFIGRNLHAVLQYKTSKINFCRRFISYKVIKVKAFLMYFFAKLQIKTAVSARHVHLSLVSTFVLFNHRNDLDPYLEGGFFRSGDTTVKALPKMLPPTCYSCH